jgi:hypothetical protein
MGISVAEYFAQKEACANCVEHGDEEHCVTTLLSRKENCFFYNITHMGIGEYTEEERKLARNLRDDMTEEQLVNYYVRGENVIEAMKLFELPHYEQYAILTRIDFMYIHKITKNKDKSKVYDMLMAMLDAIEKEYPQGN